MSTTITDVAGWQAINSDLAGDYELGANLDFTGEDAVIDGTGTQAFTGTLDGKDYTISNITITSSAKGALFWENQGTIENLNIDTISVADTRTAYSIAACLTIDNSGTIEDVVITNATVASTSSSGNFAEAQGFLYRNDGGTINRCSVSFDTITATSAGTYARSFGFCNDNYGTISKCFANGTSITATATGQYAFVASFCEDNTATPDATIDDSYAIVDTLTATDGSNAARASGFIDSNTDTIDDCYVKNETITAADAKNGFCRVNSGTITNSFWDVETSGVTSSDGGSGRATTQMEDFTNYYSRGWSITRTDVDHNNHYPYLRWEYDGFSTKWGIQGLSEDSVTTRTFTIPDVLDLKGRVPKGAAVRAYRADNHAEVTAARTTIDSSGNAEVSSLPLDVDIIFHVTWGGSSQAGTQQERWFYSEILQIEAGGTGSSSTTTARSNLGLGTTDSPQFTAIELGHATDTTISRVSAALIAVEGDNLIRASDVDDTPVNGQTAVPVSSNWAYDHDNDDDVHDATAVNVSELSTATYDDVQDYVNFFGDRTLFSGGAITAHGDADGSIAIAACTAWSKESDSDTAVGKFFDYAGSAKQTLTDLSVNLIYLDYNGGTPQIVVATTPVTYGFQQDHILVGVVFRQGTAVHIFQSSNVGIQGINRAFMHAVEHLGAHRSSGLVTSDGGSLALSITAGIIYAGLNRQATTVDGSTWSYWYTSDSGSTWTEDTSQSVLVQSYNDITSGKVALGSNKYGVHWVYVDYEGSQLHIVYGQGNYTVPQAEEAGVPSVLPPIVVGYGVLIAKIINQEGTNTLTITYPWTTVFTSSLATDHNSLANLTTGDPHTQYFLLAGEGTDATLNDDTFIKFGGVASLGWETADANAHCLALALPDGGDPDVPVLVIGDQSVLNVDLGKFNGVTEPNIVAYNAGGDAYVALNAGDTNGSSSNGLTFVPAADEDVGIIYLSVTGTPTIIWDESDDDFNFNKGLDVTDNIEASGNITAGYDLIAGRRLELTEVADIGAVSAGYGYIYTDTSSHVNFYTEAGGGSTLDFHDHASRHTDGTDDIQEASTSQKGICQLDDTPVNGETNEPITSNWAYDHAASGHSYMVWDAGVVSEETAPDNARLIFNSGDST